MSYRTSHLHPEKGESYQKLFTSSPYRKMVWKFEQDVLGNIIEKYFHQKAISHLDFACGTGRILTCLETRSTLSIGVDVSSSMLDVAKRNTKRSRLILADITQENIFQDQKFNLITAFRFFPNAENELRRQAMATLSDLLSTDGYLVFNNHKHTGSTRNRLARLAGRRKFKGMSIEEVKNLTQKYNFEVVETYSLCIFPASEKNTLLPIAILSPIEKALKNVSFLSNLGENLIFVCRKTTSTDKAICVE